MSIAWCTALKQAPGVSGKSSLGFINASLHRGHGVFGAVLSELLQTSPFRKVCSIASGNIASVRSRNTSPLPRNKKFVATFLPYSTCRQFHYGRSWLRRSSKNAPPNRPRKQLIPFGTQSPVQLREIFEQEVSIEEGNEMLRALQERRVMGSLMEFGVRFEGDLGIPVESRMKALEWLRANYPVDEQSHAQRWAAKEAKKLEGTYIARAQRLGLLKPADDEAVSVKSTSDTSTSVIEQFKKHHEERRAREAKEKEVSGENQRQQELALARREARDQAQLDLNEKISKRREERARKGMITPDDAEIPDMTLSQRLLRPTLFGCALLVSFYFLSVYYTPVPQEHRLFPEYPTSVATVGAIVGINFVIFCLWHFPPAWRILQKYATSVVAVPYTFSVIGNTFSHRTFKHLAQNMLAVGLFGASLHEDVGRGNWLALYLAGGVLGSMTSLWFHALTKNLATYTQGASGCVYALMAAWAVVNFSKPQAQADDFSLALDISRWSVIVIMAVPNFIRSVAQQVDVTAHLGGAVSGLLSALWLKRKESAPMQGRLHEEVPVGEPADREAKERAEPES